MVLDLLTLDPAKATIPHLHRVSVTFAKNMVAPIMPTRTEVSVSISTNTVPAY